MAVALERQRREQPRRGAARVDRVQLVARDGEDGRAARLDDVGLVDALLLHVGGRVVLLRHRRRRGGLGAPPSRRAPEHPHGGAGEADRRRRLRARAARHVAAPVAGERGAGAERLQRGSSSRSACASSWPRPALLDGVAPRDRATQRSAASATARRRTRSGLTAAPAPPRRRACPSGSRRPCSRSSSSRSRCRPSGRARTGRRRSPGRRTAACPAPRCPSARRATTSR